MADELMTTADMADGKLDLTTLKVYINGDENVVNEPRLAPGVNVGSLAALNKHVKDKVDLQIATLPVGRKGYKTYAEAQGAQASLPANTVVEVNNDSDSTKNGVYTWDGTTLTKSNNDALGQAKAYIDSYATVKQVKVKSGDDTNLFVKTGVYYHWDAHIAEANLPNWALYSGGNAVFGTLVVYNPTNIESYGLTQIFYPYLDSAAPMIRKKSQGTGWTPWVEQITENNRHKPITLSTQGTDVLTLAVGNYTINSVATGNSLVNMPNCPYKFGRIEVKTTAYTYKIITFYPYGRDKNYYVNSSYEGGVFTGWMTFKDVDSLNTALASLYSTKSETSKLTTAIVESISGVDYFGKSYTAAHLTGNAMYFGAYYAGFNDATGSKSAIFNAIEGLIYCPAGTEVEWRLYMVDKVTVGTLGNTVSAANALLPDYSGTITDFPTTASVPVTINLGSVVTIPANTQFVIVFRNKALSATMRIAYFNATNPLSMPSRGFSIGTQALDWGGFSIGATSAASGYYQAGFRLKLLSSTTSSTNNSGTVETYVPSIVLPPKIYALEGLERHIYPEHLVAENYDLYNYDFTCTKGSQRKRGFVWTPSSSDTAGNYALSVSIYDKQKATQLAAADSTLVLSSKSAKSGITQKVLVIGDSLVAAGTITQRLLDIDASDVMNLALVGTRGTAPNLHEGRGGWTIADYTGAGRTYYKFTVSSVTTSPAINAANYTYNGSSFLVQEVVLNGGSGTITASLSSGSAPTAGSTGTLTKSNSAEGDATIAFSNVQTVSGNPFWNGSAIDFANYLTANSLQTPDIALIQLGVNDTFGFTSDSAVESFTITAFSQLDTLIASIKASNANVKIGVCLPPVYANQDAFGINYACGQTAWRAKRNIVTWNKKAIAYFKDKEASNIYVVASGLNVDTENNFPTTTQAINSQNSNTVTVQSNGVHPDVSGYKQIGDTLFAFIKAI